MLIAGKESQDGPSRVWNGHRIQELEGGGVLPLDSHQGFNLGHHAK